MDLERKIKQVLEANKLTTISTIDPLNNQPQSALIAFAENEALELFFQTSNKTRKYQNIQSNNRVAFVIGFGWTNIQYEGHAQQIEDEQQLEQVKRLFEAKESPTTRHYLDLPDTVIYKVSPSWIGYRNYDGHPPEVEELHF